MPTPAVEECLESIYKLQARGVRVIGARLAEDLGVSAPTITELLRRLCRQGLAEIGPERQVGLTDAGLREAESLIRRHRLSERLLTDILGMSWTQAHDEACRLEHAISPEVEKKLAAALSYPTTCPHGNPIPGLSAAGADVTRLSDLREGDAGVVSCIDAEDEEFLEYLQGLGLFPGARVELISRAPFEGPLELRVGETVGYIGRAAAERLLLEEESSVAGAGRSGGGEEGMAASTYNVPAVSCAHCKRVIEEALGSLEGVTSVHVDVDTKQVEVVFDDVRVTEDVLKERLAEEGYPAA